MKLLNNVWLCVRRRRARREHEEDNKDNTTSLTEGFRQHDVASPEPDVARINRR
jgi:hypothetical protein